ncbi:unnamed protein product, partial [Prorocentrum cordatum]
MLLRAARTWRRCRGLPRRRAASRDGFSRAARGLRTRAEEAPSAAGIAPPDATPRSAMPGRGRLTHLLRRWGVDQLTRGEQVELARFAAHRWGQRHLPGAPGAPEALRELSSAARMLFRQRRGDGGSSTLRMGGKFQAADAEDRGRRGGGDLLADALRDTALKPMQVGQGNPASASTGDARVLVRVLLSGSLGTPGAAMAAMEADDLVYVRCGGLETFNRFRGKAQDVRYSKSYDNGFLEENAIELLGLDLGETWLKTRLFKMAQVQEIVPQSWEKPAPRPEKLTCYELLALYSVFRYGERAELLELLYCISDADGDDRVPGGLRVHDMNRVSVADLTMFITAFLGLHQGVDKDASQMDEQELQ